MADWRGIKLEHKKLSSDTFKISVQELTTFLTEFWSDLLQQLNSLIPMQACILSEKNPEHAMDVDAQQDAPISANQKIIPYLEGKLRRFSISNSGISLSKSLSFWQN